MTHTNSTNGARNDTSTASIPRLTGWRHSATWTYLIMLIASAVALGASFILSAETLQLARHPESPIRMRSSASPPNQCSLPLP